MHEGKTQTCCFLASVIWLKYPWNRFFKSTTLFCWQLLASLSLVWRIAGLPWLSEVRGHASLRAVHLQRTRWPRDDLWGPGSQSRSVRDHDRIAVFNTFMRSVSCEIRQALVLRPVSQAHNQLSVDALLWASGPSSTEDSEVRRGHRGHICSRFEPVTACESWRIRHTGNSKVQVKGR